MHEANTNREQDCESWVGVQSFCKQVADSLLFSWQHLGRQFFLHYCFMTPTHKRLYKFSRIEKIDRWVSREHCDFDSGSKQIVTTISGGSETVLWVRMSSCKPSTKHLVGYRLKIYPFTCSHPSFRFTELHFAPSDFSFSLSLSLSLFSLFIRILLSYFVIYSLALCLHSLHIRFFLCPFQLFLYFFSLPLFDNESATGSWMLSP